MLYRCMCIVYIIVRKWEIYFSMNIMCTTHNATWSRNAKRECVCVWAQAQAHVYVCIVCVHQKLQHFCGTLWHNLALGLLAHKPQPARRRRGASIVCFVFLFVLLFAFWISCINFFFHIALIRWLTLAHTIRHHSFPFSRFLSDCFIHSLSHRCTLFLTHLSTLYFALPLLLLLVVVLFFFGRLLGSVWYFHFVADSIWTRLFCYGCDSDSVRTWVMMTACARCYSKLSKNYAATKLLLLLHTGNNIYAWTLGQLRLPLPYVLRQHNTLHR